MRVALAAAAATLALAAPAHAQLPLPTATPGAPPVPPVVVPGELPSETFVLGGDGARRGGWQGTGLRPPLQVAWRAKGIDAVRSPLVFGGRVFAVDDGRAVALAAGDGRVLWKRRTGSEGFPSVLAGGPGRLFAVDLARDRAQSFDPADGTLRWEVAVRRRSSRTGSRASTRSWRATRSSS